MPSKRLILVRLAAMLLVAWAAFSWIEAEKEVRILCQQFQPNATQQHIVATLETGDYLQYTIREGTPLVITVATYFNPTVGCELTIIDDQLIHVDM